MAYSALNCLCKSLGFIMTVDKNENLLGVSNRADAYGKSLSRNCLGVIAEET